MDYMKQFFDLYSEENIKLKREIVEDIIKDIIINRQVSDIDEFNRMTQKLRTASQISSAEILSIYHKYAVKYNVSNNITEFYQNNNKDLIDKAVLTWQQVCKIYKENHLKVKVTRYHINNGWRIADELIVLAVLSCKQVEDATRFCKNNEVIAYTMNHELKF